MRIGCPIIIEEEELLVVVVVVVEEDDIMFIPPIGIIPGMPPIIGCYIPIIPGI